MSPEAAGRIRFRGPGRGKPAATPPGPRTARALLGARWLMREHRLLEDCRRRYGDVFSLDMWPLGLLVVICDPEQIRRLFTADSEALRAGEGNALTEPVAGPESVLVLDGDRHLGRRKLMLPSFHGERIAVYGETIAAITAEEIDSWPLGAKFSLQPSMQTITLRVILRAIFGIEDRARGAELEALIPNLIASPALLSPLLRRDLGPGSPWRRFCALRARVDTLLFAEIARKRADPELAERDDILSMLLGARDEQGRALSDGELRDQLVTLVLAGHETTATALAWTFERLLRNPLVLTRLRDSLALGEQDYLRQTIKESLRSRPVIPYALRYVAEPFELGRHTIPAGALIGASTILTHNRADIYPDPGAFRPERFAAKGSDTYTWIPFGGGVRRCLGAAFATFEMEVILRAVLERCELSAPDPRPERPQRRFVTYQPAQGAAVVLKERRAAPGRPGVRSAAEPASLDRARGLPPRRSRRL